MDSFFSGAAISDLHTILDELDGARSQGFELLAFGHYDESNNSVQWMWKRKVILIIFDNYVRFYVKGI